MVCLFMQKNLSNIIFIIVWPELTEEVFEQSVLGKDKNHGKLCCVHGWFF